MHDNTTVTDALNRSKLRELL